MALPFDLFEALVRRTQAISFDEGALEPPLHPFDMRNIHPALPPNVKRLFDDGHFAESTFAAFKFVDKIVQKFSGLKRSGEGLMMEAFSEKAPAIQLTPLSNISEVDEQRGYKFIFSGGVVAIRNPRGHENFHDDVDTCLDHLAFASLLIRRLEESGFVHKP